MGRGKNALKDEHGSWVSGDEERYDEGNTVIKVEEVSEDTVKQLLIFTTFK